MLESLRDPDIVCFKHNALFAEFGIVFAESFADADREQRSGEHGFYRANIRLDW